MEWVENGFEDEERKKPATQRANQRKLGNKANNKMQQQQQ